MKSKIRVFKLVELNPATPAGNFMSVAEYAAEKKVTVNAIYNKIDAVLNDGKQWDGFIAYRKGDNIVICKINPINPQLTKHNGKKQSKQIRNRQTAR
jgi:hypothetical protein